MQSVPTLDELAQNQTAIVNLPVHAAKSLLAQVVALQTALLAECLAASHCNGPPSKAPASENYLTVEEVVQRFHVSRKWLYRHKEKMPHSQPSRKVLLFPEQAIMKWFASRKRT